MPPATLSPIESYLRTLHAKFQGLARGKVADYIPELAHADPDWFGICIATRDGHVYEVGDTRQPFTIQSISKALVYGLALEDRHENAVLRRIGVEPSGEAFNAISLKPGSGAPFNPMINAGAIAACGLVQPQDGRTRIDRIVDYIGGCAGRPLEVDDAVYRSESATGHRNRAIGWMLRNFGILAEEPTEVLETYFRQCAIQVTCRDLAVIGATLANQGVNPLTGRRAMAADTIDNVLSVMSTCGMYDFSGEWIYRVGLPAKSGVGGGILAVLPGQLGIGVFSPPLDAQGNSARGIAVCSALSQDLALHLFHPGAGPLPALRLAYDNSQVRSRRRRPEAEREVLAAQGRRVRVLELQGDLVFSSLEPVVRAVHAQAADCTAFVLCLRNVVSANDAGLRLLGELQRALAGRGVRLLVCNASGLTTRLLRHGLHADSLLADEDAALEACEDLLIAAALGPAWRQGGACTLAGCELTRALPAEDIAWLEQALPHRRCAAGQAIVRAGDPGDALYILLDGCAEVRLAGDPKASRIDVFGPGMSFGEMAFIDDAPRSADVVAVAPALCRVLDRATFTRLERERPGLKIALLERIARQMSANLRRMNAEVLAFKS